MGLRDGCVPVVADGGRLHNVAGETYAVAPARFEAFAAGRDLAAATVRNRLVRVHSRPPVPVSTAFVRAAARATSRAAGHGFDPSRRALWRPLTRLRRREFSCGAIRQAMYAAQSSIRIRRRPNRSLRR